MNKILLDGYGITLKAIRSTPNPYPHLHPDGHGGVIIETDKGSFRISGCSNCETVWFSEFIEKGEDDEL